MRDMTEHEITATAAARFDPGSAELVTPSPADLDAAKKTISARVPESVSNWLITEAIRAKVTPSALIAELLAEAIAARQPTTQAPRKLVDVADVHRLLDSLARAA